MNRLHESTQAIRGGVVWPVLSQERLFATEHVAAKLDLRPSETACSVLAHTLLPGAVAGLSASDLRQALDDAWSGPVPPAVPAALLASALARNRRSCDRAVIEAYFMRYPASHAGFALLREAACTAAERHAWHWRVAGRRYRLWDADAADRCAAIHAAPDAARALLRELGLIGRLAQGGFAAILLPPSSGDGLAL